MENKDFAERNVGLVRALVPRFLGRGIEYDDLFRRAARGSSKLPHTLTPTAAISFPHTPCLSF